MADNGNFFMHGDHLGRPLAMTNTSGTLIWRAEYEPFGKSLAPRTNTLSFAPRFRFPGRWENQDSGDLPGGATGILGSINALTDNWYRTYAQRWGRYTQADPIHPVLPEMPNVGFGYGNGNPLSETDPFGLFVIDRGFPKSCQTTFNQAIDIVRTTLANKPGCNRCTAIGPSLQELFESPNLVIGFVENSSQGPCAYGETPW